MFDEDDEDAAYTIWDLEPGMTVDCGAYGERIIVCHIVDNHRFWGTDSEEEYEANGEDASGWYFDVNCVENILSSDDEEDDDY